MIVADMEQPFPVSLCNCFLDNVESMTPEQKERMLAAQSERWVKSEMQWAKDFREGKCERD